MSTLNFARPLAAGIIAIPCMILFACNSRTSSSDSGSPMPSVSAKPPIAATHPYKVESPNGAREDDYYWLRDDTRANKEMLDYLNAENAYTDAMLGHTKP